MSPRFGERGYWTEAERRDLERSVISGLVTAAILYVVLRRALKARTR